MSNNGDFFYNLLNTAPDNVIKQLIMELFPSEGGTMLSGILLVLNTGLAFAAVSWFVFQFAMHVLTYGVAKASESADENSPVHFLNDSMVVGYMRSLTALSLLIPSTASGLNLFNHIIIMGLLAASNLGQAAWDQGQEHMFSTEYAAPVYDSSNVSALTRQLFEANACYHYLKIETTGQPGEFQKVNDRTLEFDGRPKLWGMLQNSSCGTFELGDPTDAAPLFMGMTNTAFFGIQMNVGDPLLGMVHAKNLFKQEAARRYYEQYKTAFNAFQGTMNSAGKALALAYYPRTSDQNSFDAETWAEDIQEAEDQFIDATQEAFAAVRVELFKQANTNRHNEESLKWHMAGGYYTRFADANFTINTMRDKIAPTVQPTNWQEIWGDDPQDHVVIFAQGTRTFVNADNPLMAFQTPESKVPTVDSSGAVSFLLKFLNDSIAEINVRHDDSVNPISILNEYGNYYAVVSGAAGALKIALGVNPLTLTIHEALSPYLTAISFGFGAVAFAFTHIIPMIPWFFFAASMLSWMIHAITLFTGGSVAVLMNVKTNSKEIVIGTIWQGMILLVCRPILTLAGLAFGYSLFAVASKYINATLTPAINNMDLTSLGSVIGWIFWPFIHSLLLAVVAFACFSLIKILPDQVTKYLPDGSLTLEK